MSVGASGFHAWLVQRVSAIYLAVYVVGLCIHFSINPVKDYQGWTDWASHPFASITLSLFFFSLLLHVWVGMRDVIIDYVHSTKIRISILALLAIVLIGFAFWLLKAIVIVSL